MRQQQPNERIVATLVAAVAAAALGAACTAMPQPQQPPRAVVSPGPEFLAPLEGQYWRLATLGGRPLTGDPQGHPYIRFDQETGRISGSTGCNRLVGGYRVSADTISIDQAGATMMACVGPGRRWRSSSPWIRPSPRGDPPRVIAHRPRAQSPTCTTPSATVHRVGRRSHGMRRAKPGAWAGGHACILFPGR
jgi:heat shock protein HslJ